MTKLTVIFVLFQIASIFSISLPDQRERYTPVTPNDMMGRIAAAAPPPNGPPILNGGGPVNFNTADGQPLPSAFQQAVYISITEDSKLYVAPGTTAIVTFTFKNNNGAVASAFTIFGGDEKKFFQGLESQNQIILQPGQIATVRGQIMVPAGFKGGRSLLTIFAMRSIDGAQSARAFYIYPKAELGETNAPYCKIISITRCDEFTQESNCFQRYWNYKVEVRDTEAGLRSINLRPESRFVGDDFIIGTNETVSILHSSSCCNPTVDISAVDLRGNTANCRADTNALALGSGDIAAIVLGVLLLLLVLAIIIIVIYRCCKKRKSVKTSTFPKKKKEPQ